MTVVVLIFSYNIRLSFLNYGFSALFSLISALILFSTCLDFILLFFFQFKVEASFSNMNIYFCKIPPKRCYLCATNVDMLYFHFCSIQNLF